jgi:signal peptidase I
MKFAKFIKPTWKKILISIALIIVLSLLLRAATGMWLSSPWYAVSTNSMNPAFQYGDTAILNQANLDKLKVGDVVISKSSSGLLLHRIIEINNDRTFTTKGDANPASLSIQKNIYENQIIGKVILKIPLMGYLDIIHIGWLIRLVIIYLIGCLIAGKKK